MVTQANCRHLATAGIHTHCYNSNCYQCTRQAMHMRALTCTWSRRGICSLDCTMLLNGFFRINCMAEHKWTPIAQEGTSIPTITCQNEKYHPLNFQIVHALLHLFDPLFVATNNRKCLGIVGGNQISNLPSKE